MQGSRGMSSGSCRPDRELQPSQREGQANSCSGLESFAGMRLGIPIILKHCIMRSVMVNCELADFINRFFQIRVLIYKHYSRISNLPAHRHIYSRRRIQIIGFIFVSFLYVKIYKLRPSSRRIVVSRRSLLTVCLRHWFQQVTSSWIVLVYDAW